MQIFLITLTHTSTHNNNHELMYMLAFFIGMKVDGRVTSVTSFGVFVRLANSEASSDIVLRIVYTTSGWW